MKVRTVGVLAALGMSLTSYSVWSLTAPEGSPGAERTAQEWHAESPPEQAATTQAGFLRDGTLHVAARLGHPRLPSGSTTETFVLVSVRADANAVGRPAPRHLAIVVDRSGSMRGKRLANALAAAQSAVRRLADGDSVSVVDYSNTAHVLVAPTELGAETRERVLAALGSLTAGGETCISCGLETSLGLLQRRSDAVERVLLLSDGQATSGILDVAGMQRLAGSVRARGATVTTIGVDVDYNERLMTAIAQATNGRHYFVASPEGLPAIFERELSGLERSVAREASVELELAPGVELTQVMDRGFTRDGSRVTIPLGSFAAGEERSVLARVRVTPGAAREMAVASARVRYDDLVRVAPVESGGELVALVTQDGSRAPLDPEVAEHVERSGTVAALNDANGLFESGDAAGALERIAKKRDEVQRGRAVALAAAPAPRKAALAQAFDKEEAALESAASAFAEPPPSATSSGAELRRSKAALKQNAARAADLAF